MQRKIFNFIIICLLFCVNNIYGQVNHKVSFAKDYSIESVELGDANIYNQVKATSMQFADSIGYPALPVKYINLLIPANSKATEIIINKVLRQTKKLDYRVASAQYPEPISVDDSPKGFVEPNKSSFRRKQICTKCNFRRKTG